MIYIAILTKHLFRDLMRPIFYQFFSIVQSKFLTLIQLYDDFLSGRFIHRSLTDLIFKAYDCEIVFRSLLFQGQKSLSQQT